MLRNLILCLPFALAACGGTPASTGPVTMAPPAAATPQSVAQQIQAKWPQIKVAASLALIAEGAQPAQVAIANTAENTLFAQVSACATGTDATCLSSFKPAAQAFLASITLGPKGQAELLLVQALLPPDLVT